MTSSDTTDQPDARTSALTVDFASERGTRPTNQDAAEYAHHHTNGQPAHVVVAVADGMGSNSKSHLIAQAAVNLVTAIGHRRNYRTTPGELIELARIVLPEMGRFIDGPHAAAFFDFDDEEPGRRPDTTLIVATVDLTGDIHASWYGDSRAYLLTRSGALHLLTRDHNEAEEFGGSPHVLTRSLAHPNGEPDNIHWPAHDNGDHAARLLLTTDGVHQPLTHTEIHAILREAPTPADAAQQLTIKAVAAAGDHADNATALVIDIPTDTQG
ncbi:MULTISPECIES: PP2C family protein-serine/threonine phosphatase [Nocardia]|uniref:PP2C family protein-serine/threonine phosphatase n=1 Tax=Nocardia TaxID=1817 RepID=UPI0024585408|nr:MULTISPECIES: protein phosphatase 2C domain-containing protein [Nocardia]